MKTLKLKHPMTFGKTEITELKFREYATAEDLLAFDERGATRQTIVLISSLTGTDESMISKLHVSDFRAADAIASELIRPEADEKNEQKS
jgi:hypothetical protein